jgi:hypothetical protein
MRFLSSFGKILAILGDWLKMAFFYRAGRKDEKAHFDDLARQSSARLEEEMENDKNFSDRIEFDSDYSDRMLDRLNNRKSTDK